MAQNLPADLASILRTLSQSQKHQPIHQSATIRNQKNERVARREQDEEYDPTNFTPMAQAPTNPDLNHQISKEEVSTAASSAEPTTSLVPKASAMASAPAPASAPASTPQSQSQQGQSKAKTETSEITTWPPALRHVMQLTHSPAFLDRIRKMRASQATHEAQWWSGREALAKTQAERATGRAQIEAILKGVGGSVNSQVQGPTPEDDEAELKAYDLKVWKCVQQMEKDMSRQLGEMDVPFFVEPSGDALLSAKERKEMQRKMMELLEDLIGD